MGKLVFKLHSLVLALPYQEMIVQRLLLSSVILCRLLLVIFFYFVTDVAHVRLVHFNELCPALNFDGFGGVKTLPQLCKCLLILTLGLLVGQVPLHRVLVDLEADKKLFVEVGLHCQGCALLQVHLTLHLIHVLSLILLYVSVRSCESFYCIFFLRS